MKIFTMKKSTTIIIVVILVAIFSIYKVNLLNQSQKLELMIRHTGTLSSLLYNSTDDIEAALRSNKKDEQIEKLYMASQLLSSAYTTSLILDDLWSPLGITFSDTDGLKNRLNTSQQTMAKNMFNVIKGQNLNKSEIKRYLSMLNYYKKVVNANSVRDNTLKAKLNKAENDIDTMLQNTNTSN